ncbi:MAG: hypothetical protein GF364_19870 [Candidatus Lokiarchaeota archaeon]|nr:hypothetical protein [Candidatus Lokiarchaeota archaeon]
MKARNKTTSNESSVSKGIERFVITSIVIGTFLSLILHVYTAIILAINNVPREDIIPTLLFEGLLIGGFVILWLITGKGQLGGFIKFITYVIPLIYNMAIWMWQQEQFHFFEQYKGLYFPYNTFLMLAWMVVLLIDAFYLLIYALIALIRVLARKTRLIDSFQNFPKKLNNAKVVFLILSALMIVFAKPITDLYVNKGTVHRTVSVQDMNYNCNLSVWDYPKVDVQIGDTQEIDLGALTEDETRLLTAFGEMDTTFYHQLSIDTEKQRNGTIAYLKLLDEFNISICQTIWYDGIEGFPGPIYAENWIGQARNALEFLVDEDITNVVGICCDSERKVESSPEDYWEQIGLYDEFLQEIQTNESLKHPSPDQETFETVLCFDPRAVFDKLDEDQDIIINRMAMGLPPDSWTKYHFMQYRGNPGSVPTETYLFNILLKEHIGVEDGVPTLGVTGVEWFAEGYFDGTYEDFGQDPQLYDYDGIDGWEAMKREILYSKAMGFHSVSVFHLNSYGDPTKIESHGWLDYYGLETIEELAEEWNQPKVIEFPICSSDFKLSRGGFFNPMGDFQYDLLTNIEMHILRTIGLVLVISAPFLPQIAFKSRKRGEKSIDNVPEN